MGQYVVVKGSYIYIICELTGNASDSKKIGKLMLISDYIPT